MTIYHAEIIDYKQGINASSFTTTSQPGDLLVCITYEIGNRVSDPLGQFGYLSFPPPAKTLNGGTQVAKFFPNNDDLDYNFPDVFHVSCSINTKTISSVNEVAVLSGSAGYYVSFVFRGKTTTPKLFMTEGPPVNPPYGLNNGGFIVNGEYFSSDGPNVNQPYTVPRRLAPSIIFSFSILEKFILSYPLVLPQFFYQNDSISLPDGFLLLRDRIIWDYTNNFLWTNGGSPLLIRDQYGMGQYKINIGFKEINSPSDVSETLIHQTQLNGTYFTDWLSSSFTILSEDVRTRNVELVQSGRTLNGSLIQENDLILAHCFTAINSGNFNIPVGWNTELTHLNNRILSFRAGPSSPNYDANTISFTLPSQICYVYYTVWRNVDLVNPVEDALTRFNPQISGLNKVGTPGGVQYLFMCGNASTPIGNDSGSKLPIGSTEIIQSQTSQNEPGIPDHYICYFDLDSFEPLPDRNFVPITNFLFAQSLILKPFYEPGNPVNAGGTTTIVEIPSPPIALQFSSEGGFSLRGQASVTRRIYSYQGIGGLTLRGIAEANRLICLTKFAANEKEPVSVWIPSQDPNRNVSSQIILSDQAGIHDGTLTNFGFGQFGWQDDTGAGGGKALIFDGTNDYIDFGGDSFFNLPSFTYSAWVKIDASNTGLFRPILVKNGSTYLGVYCSNDAENGLIYGQINGSGSSITRVSRPASGAPAVAMGVWQHVAMTYNGGTSPFSIKLFLNGVQVDNQTYTSGTFTGINNSANSLRAGRSTFEYFDGSMDDIRIFDKVLNLSDVVHLRNSGRRGVVKYVHGLCQKPSGFTLGATSLSTEKYKISGTGGLTLRGESLLVRRRFDQVDAIGGLTLRGQASAVKRRYKVSGSGGLTLRGQSTIVRRRFETSGTGGLTLRGVTLTGQNFVSTWKTDNIRTGSSNNNQVKLPLSSFGTYNFTVKWGDGTSNVITSWNQAQITHTYASIGTYTITITGTCEFFGFDGNNDTDELKVLSVSDWGTVKLRGSAFAGCTNLTSVASNLNLSGVTTLSSTWFGCTGLTSFPLIDTSNVTRFEFTWMGCTGLTSFPAIDTSSANHFNATWANCTGLTSFPLIDTSGVSTLSEYFNSVWANCTGLTSFPLIDTSSITRFLSTWSGCTGLASFPLIDTSNVIDFYQAWSGCTGLTSFPLIDTSSGIDFFATWANCTGLTSFPLINTSNGTNFLGTWFYCSGLTSFPLIDTSNGTNFGETWNNCSSLTSFPLIDVSSGITFNRAWEGCSSLTSFPAINASSGTNFSNSWNNCSSLTSFPLVNVSSGQNFSGTWFNCSSLTLFPAINASNGTTFYQAWQNCSSLPSFPLVNVSSGLNFQTAWWGCTNLKSFAIGFGLNLGSMTDGYGWLSLTSLTANAYSRLLQEILAVNSNIGVRIDTSAYYNNTNGVASRTALITNQGWDIYDLGPQPTDFPASATGGLTLRGQSLTRYRINGTGGLTLRGRSLFEINRGTVFPKGGLTLNGQSTTISRVPLNLLVSSYEIEAIGEFSQFDITSYEVEVLGADRLVSPFSLDISTYEIEAIGEFSQSQISYYGIEVLGSDVFRERVSFIGGFTLSGDSLDFVRYLINPTGGLTLSGQSPFKIRYPFSSTGGFTLSGDSLDFVRYLINPTGGLTLSGQSPFKIRYPFSSTGGFTLSGDSLDFVRYLIHPSGGFDLSGDSLDFVRYLIHPSGGFDLSGDSLDFVRYLIHPSGGFDLSGDSLDFVRYLIHPSGGFTLSGISPFKMRYIFSGVGGFTLSGQSSPLKVFRNAYQTLLEITLSGDSLDFVRYLIYPTGLFVLSGQSITDELYVSSYEIEAIGEFSQFDITSYEVEVLGADRLVSPFSLDISSYEIEAIGEFSQSQISYYGIEVLGSNVVEPKGGFTISGQSDFRIISTRHVRQGFGGFTLSGQSPFKIIRPTYQTIGGFNLSGQALTKEINVFQPTGGFVLSGESPFATRFRNLSTGGLTLSGESAIVVNYKFNSSGGLTLGSSAEIVFDSSYDSSGGFTLSGESPFQVRYSSVGTGGLTLSGESISINFIGYIHNSSGELILGGESSVVPTFNFDSFGGLILRGQSLTPYKFNINSSGGLVLNGESPFQVRYSSVVTGGLTLSGESTLGARYSSVATGGLILGGRSSVVPIIKVNSSGGLILSGQSSFKVRYPFFGTGGLTLSGQSNPFPAIKVNSSGGLVLSGLNSANLYSFGYYRYSSSGGLVLDGESPFQMRYPFSGIGGLTLSGESSSSITNYKYNSSGGLTLSGESLVSFIIKVDTSGGLIFTSVDPLIFNVTFGHVFESEWHVDKLVEKEWEFQWDVGKGVLHYYQVEGKCVTSSCDITGLGPVCSTGSNKSSFIQIIAATSVADLCDKYRLQFMNAPTKWPIEKIRKHKRPVFRSDEELVLSDDENPSCNTLTEEPFCHIPECFDFCLDEDLVEEFTVDTFVQDVFTIIETSGPIRLAGTSIIKSNSLTSGGTLSFSGTSYIPTQIRSNVTSIGGISLRGESSITSDNWKYISDSGIFKLSNSALINSSNIWHYLPIGQFKLNGGINHVEFLDVEFGSDEEVNIAPVYPVNPNETLEPILPDQEDVYAECFCDPMPLKLSLVHNLNESYILKQFLRKNGYNLDEEISLNFCNYDNTWRFNKQWQDSNEAWILLVEWGCVSQVGGNPLDVNLWKLSILIKRNVFNDSRYETRILYTLPTSPLCTNSRMINLSTEIDTNSGEIALPDDLEARDQIIVDDIAIFGSAYWLTNNLKINIAEDLTVPNTRLLDISPVFP